MILFLMVTELATLVNFSETINPIAFWVTRSRSNYWSSSRHCPRNILYSIKVLNITNQNVVLLPDWKATCYRNWKSRCYILKYLRLRNCITLNNFTHLLFLHWLGNNWTLSSVFYFVNCFLAVSISVLSSEYFARSFPPFWNGSCR